MCEAQIRPSPSIEKSSELNDDQNEDTEFPEDDFALLANADNLNLKKI